MQYQINSKNGTSQTKVGSKNSTNIGCQTAGHRSKVITPLPAEPISRRHGGGTIISGGMKTTSADNRAAAIQFNSDFGSQQQHQAETL